MRGAGGGCRVCRREGRERRRPGRAPDPTAAVTPAGVPRQAHERNADGSRVTTAPESNAGLAWRSTSRIRTLHGGLAVSPMRAGLPDVGSPLRRVFRGLSPRPDASHSWARCREGGTRPPTEPRGWAGGRWSVLLAGYRKTDGSSQAPLVGTRAVSAMPCGLPGPLFDAPSSGATGSPP